MNIYRRNSGVLVAMAAGVGLGLGVPTARAQSTIPPPMIPPTAPTPIPTPIPTPPPGHGYPVPSPAPTVVHPSMMMPHYHAPERGGRLHRAAQHVGATLVDRAIGYPEYFKVPPLGYDVMMNNSTQIANTNQHQFLLYRSDFYSDTDKLTPNGAMRLARMANQIHHWHGPMVIQAVPDRPGLAEARREAILAALDGAGVAVDPNRLLVGMSFYYGLRGDEAAGDYGVMLQRAIDAGAVLPLPPLPNADLSVAP